MASTIPDRSSATSPDPEAARLAMIAAALAAYDDAGLSGLCAEGRWEVAIGALRNLDLDVIASRTQRVELEKHGVLDGTDTTLGVPVAEGAPCRVI